MNIIKQNPFRVLGLTGNATEKELQKQIGIIKRYAEVGKSKSFDYDFDFIGGFTRSAEEIQEASNRIEQAHKKFLYSLFWFVKNTQFDEIAFNNLKEKEIEKAIEIWNKTLKEEVSTKNYSSYLNLSTLYIALSTIEEQIDLQKLQKGISLKGNLIHSESLKDLSKLITGNGVANDPIDISKKFVDEVTELLKPYLNKNNGISTNDLISLFNTFPSNIQKYISSKFTEVPISAIENKIEETSRKRKNSPQNADKYAEELYKSSKHDITQLKNLMRSSNVQFRMLSDKVANEILQCSVDYFNDRQEHDIDDNFETNLSISIKLIKLADSVAISDQVKDRAKENLETLLEMKDRAIKQAVDLLMSIKKAYETNESKILRQVKLQEASLAYGQSINWTKVNELIKNSVDWEKVISVIYEVIPSTNIEKIKNTNDAIKQLHYKELVEFILDKMSSNNKSKVAYLSYWNNKKGSVNSRKTSTTNSNSHNSQNYDGTIIFIIVVIVIAIIAAIVSSNYHSSNTNKSNEDIPSFDEIYFPNESNENLPPFSEIEGMSSIESVYKGNKLSNGSSPYDNFFGKGIYNKNHENWIEFKNGYQSDAIVCLVDYYAEKTIRNEYMQAGTSFKMTNVPNGTYYIKVFSGKDWNPTKVLANGKIKGGFDTDETFYESSDLMVLDDDGYQYSTIEITLYKVSSGNMQTQDMSETSFFN